MNKEEYGKYKKVVAELDGYDICDEFNLGTYELKDKKKLLEIVLMYYFKNQDELEKKDKEIERLNNIINELEKWLEERRTHYCMGCSNIYEDSLGKTRLVNEDIFDEITKIKKIKEFNFKYYNDFTD